MAAILSCGPEPGALLSHRSAAWLWGLTSRFARPVDVTTPTRRQTRIGIRIHSAVDNLLARSKGFRGVARLRDAVTVYRIPGFTRSDFERFFLAMTRSAGLPQPSMNFVAAGYELDAYWPAERFAVELDTYEYHGSPAAFERDRKRQEDLKLAGIEIVRITGTRFEREPRAVATRIRKLLRQRHRDLKRASPQTPN